MSIMNHKLRTLFAKTTTMADMFSRTHSDPVKTRQWEHRSSLTCSMVCEHCTNRIHNYYYNRQRNVNRTNAGHVSLDSCTFARWRKGEWHAFHFRMGFLFRFTKFLRIQLFSDAFHFLKLKWLERENSKFKKLDFAVVFFLC